MFSSAFLIGIAGAFLGPTLAAITLGLVGGDKFDAQFSRNQGFNSAGNVFSALLIGFIGYRLGYRAVFLAAAVFTIPRLLALARIDPAQIDYARARGSTTDHKELPPESIRDQMRDRILLYICAAVFLFHLSNAAMLAQLGELLAKSNPKAAGPFMSACIIVTQLVIAGMAAWVANRAHSKGRRSLLLLGFGILPLRAILYTFTRIPALLIGI